MLLIWRRKGLLVPLSLILGSALSGIVTVDVATATLLSKFLYVITLFSPALINHLFSKYFVKNEGIKILTDENGKEYKFDSYSKFFFIKNSTWTILFLIGGIIIAPVILFN
jgi:hypothetical protein